MNSTKWAETPYFQCGPSSQNENKKKGSTRDKKKNMRMDNSKEDTEIYIHMCIYTHTDGHTNIHTYRYTMHNTHIHYSR